MVERGEDLTLGAEARQHTIRVHATPDQLDRDALLILLVGALGEIDGAHAAMCDLVKQMIRADDSLHGRHIVGDQARNDRWRRRLGDEAVGMLVRREEALDLLAQEIVSGAG